jgi:hypothetical protein
VPTGRAIMAVILLVLGILATAAGIIAVGFGIPISEFSLGNTLILSGTIGLSAGLVLIGLATAVGQLAQLLAAQRTGAVTRPVRSKDKETVEPPALAAPAPRSVQAKAPAAKPKVEDRAPAPAPEPQAEEQEVAVEAPVPAIERLRSTLVRPDRKVEEPSEPEEEEVPLSPAVPVQAARASAGGGAAANGAAKPSGGGTVESLKGPRLDFLFRSKAKQTPPESFDNVWPKKRGGGRNAEPHPADESDEGAQGRERAPAQKSQEDTGAESEEFRQAAILKSGVVDGMAYTLYVDGSIEAQLPQGTVRFGSIAELRAHIENNS